jgi:hypothetical protein
MRPELAAAVEAYRQLRSRWPDDWPGLGTVMRGVLTWLDAPSAIDGRAEVPRVLIECADAVESSGRARARRVGEPAYHNRLHVADTLVSMASLIKARRSLLGTPGAGLTRFEMLCLLAMTVHDFHHPGRCNRGPQEIEQMSLARFAPHARRIGLSASDWALVCHLVLLTDPTGVAQVHDRWHRDRVSAKASGTRAEMALLVTEADVLASALEFPGVELTRSLASERQKPQPEMASSLLSEESRLRFLSAGVRFSSDAAGALGVKEAIREQLASIRKACKAVSA